MLQGVVVNVFLRCIAVLIVSGQVKATEIKREPQLKSFWNTKKRVKIKKNKVRKRHGIENHFLSRGFEVSCEPTLHQGRADLGVYEKGKANLLIEVGTTSLFKLWLNLKQKKHFTYLIFPNDDKLIEFIKE